MFISSYSQCFLYSWPCCYLICLKDVIRNRSWCYSFASIPNGIAAIEAVPALGWFQMIFAIGAVDYWGFLTFGDTEGKGKTTEELEKATNQELNHGRLAMIAVLELFRHDFQMVVDGMYAGDKLITGLPFLY